MDGDFARLSYMEVDKVQGLLCSQGGLTAQTNALFFPCGKVIQSICELSSCRNNLYLLASSNDSSNQLQHKASKSNQECWITLMQSPSFSQLINKHGLEVQHLLFGSQWLCRTACSLVKSDINTQFHAENLSRFACARSFQLLTRSKSLPNKSSVIWTEIGLGTSLWTNAATTFPLETSFAATSHGSRGDFDCERIAY